MSLDAGADGLQNETGRAPFNGKEALDPQNVVRGDAPRKRRQQRFGAGQFAQVDDEALDIVMVMLLLSVMVRGAVIDPVLRLAVQAQLDRTSTRLNSSH